MEPLDSELWEFPLAGGEPRKLTDRRGPDTDPAVSPDGKTVAYIGFDDKYQGYQVNQLWLVGRDGGAARSLTAGLDRDVEDPVWAPDGQSLLFRYDDHGRSFLAQISLDGKVTKVAEDLGATMGSYSGAASSPSAPRRRGLRHRRHPAASATSPTSPPNQPPAAANGSPARRPSRSCSPTSTPTSSRSAASLPSERLETPSKHDGRPIEAWLVKPPGFDPAKKYPLILEIHGGPFAAYGPHFDIEKQVWAARGFVIVYANPRGSTSYGHEFGNLIHHAYPGDDFFDLDSAVDAVVAEGFVDGDELYVTGGSGGGVLTCWTIGRTTRYRAAATVYPVINWFSWVLTSDLPAFGVNTGSPASPGRTPSTT